jgi:hypothetical protein
MRSSSACLRTCVWCIVSLTYLNFRKLIYAAGITGGLVKGMQFCCAKFAGGNSAVDCIMCDTFAVCSNSTKTRFIRLETRWYTKSCIAFHFCRSRPWKCHTLDCTVWCYYAARYSLTALRDESINYSNDCFTVQRAPPASDVYICLRVYIDLYTPKRFQQFSFLSSLKYANA